MRPFVLVGLAIALALPGEALLGAVQRPLGSVSARGETVTPAFEGWYENPDGTFTLSFGYFNRNFEEVVEIPVGSNNFFEPDDPDRGQPTRFHSRRHWGVFGIVVPEDFGEQELVWTLKMQGKTFPIPGSLHRDWEIDALGGEAGSGNTPRVLRLASDGPEGAGPLGVSAGPLTATVGEAVALSVRAWDDGRSSGSVANPGEEGEAVSLAWFKHRGPGDVTFSEGEAEIPAAGGEATTMATFHAPGEYVVRVRANDASGVAGAGHAQCCWTNGFVTVTVTR